MSREASGKTGALRGTLVGLGSVILGSVVMSAVQLANYVTFPPPDGLDFNDPQQLEQIVDAMPVAVLWMLELSCALGSFAAGVVTALGAPGRRLTVALLVGAAFTLLGFVNLAQFPAPLWLAVVTTLTYVPATLAGVFVVGRLRVGMT